MAVADPRPQKGWEEWKNVKEEDRRRTCGPDVNEEEAEEEEDTDGEEVREEDGNGAGRKRKEEGWSEQEGGGERKVTREERVNEGRKGKDTQDTEENEGDIKDVEKERERKEETEKENEMGALGNGREVVGEEVEIGMEQEDYGKDELRDHVVGSRAEEEGVQHHRDDSTVHGGEELTEEQEEDSTDDEDARRLASEDVDCNEEDAVKIIRKDDHPSAVFCTLREFRASCLLTDLHLSTEAGQSFQVHSPVLAAVSSLIRDRLSRNSQDNGRADEGELEDASVGFSRCSLSLGPEVDHLGLEAVVAFAYSGLVSGLNKDTVEQIKAAARALGATRVMELCTEEEATKAPGQKNRTRISASEQMKISLRSIQQLWMEQVGCDVTLEGVGASLHAHRVVLAAGSDYFRGMFTSGMRESRQRRVTLPFLPASELEVLIGCSYSGALPLGWRCVFEITGTALQLQYQPALTLCLSFLREQMNPRSCLDVVSFAEAYEMVQLLEIAEDFVLRQFPKVARTLKFRDLPAQQLLKYLNSPSLCVPSELVVFKAVVAWLQAKPKKRLKLAKALMKTIHFTLMTFKEFKEVQSSNMWSDHSLVELYEALFADFWSNEITAESRCRIYLPKESLVLIGGDQISEDLGSRSVSRELWFGNSLRNHTGIKKAVEWRRLGEMPEPPRFSHEVALLRGQLYVLGGKKYYGICDTLNSVYRYDPRQNSWQRLADMQEKRCLFSAVVLDGSIYAVGGHCDPECIDSVERYCAAGNSWSFTGPLDLPLCGHVAKVVQGHMFVSGGLNRDYRCLSSLFRYHPETGSTYLADMTEPRAHHCMETLGDLLYVAGGVTTGARVTVVDQLACEVYSPAADTWAGFTSLPVPHVGAGSAVLEGKLYVLGGFSQEDDSDTNMVHRCDPTTRRWESMGRMPGPNNDVRASVLRLPPHVRL